MAAKPLLTTEPTSAEAPSWYAVLSRSRHEKSVTAALNHLGMTTFLPLVQEVHRWTDRSKVVDVPLFPGYLFVRIPSSGESQTRILRTPGVVRLVGNHAGAVPIPEKEIDDVRAVLSHRTNCEPHPFLRVGQRVRIAGGALDGVEGILLKQESEQKLVISIGLIQRSLAISVYNFDVKPCAQSFAA